jgi:hypothetical protein
MWKDVYVVEGERIRSSADKGMEEEGYVQIFEVSEGYIHWADDVSRWQIIHGSVGEGGEAGEGGEGGEGGSR